MFIKERSADILIKGGRIIDGSGNLAYHSDIVIKDGKIVEMGCNLSEVTAEKTIDATGKFVTPGFIDEHTHTDASILANPLNQSTIRQGVTTEVVGHCGMSQTPLTEEAKAKGAGGFGNFKNIDKPTSTFKEFMGLIDKEGISGNLVWLVGHNTLRSIAGMSGPNYTEDQLKIMQNLLRDAFENGAFGLSTGLEFEPGRSSTTEEIIRLASVVHEYDGIYTSHIRNRDSQVFEAIDEFLDVMRKYRFRGVLSHFNIRQNTNAPENAWHLGVEKMRKAREEENLDLLTDFTPIEYGIGQMSGILPSWIRNGDTYYTCEQLGKPEIRKKLRTDCDRYWRFIHKGDWDRVRLQCNPAYPQYNNLLFPEIAKIHGKDEWECYFDILQGAGELLDSCVMVGWLFPEQMVIDAITDPMFMMVADGFSTLTEGILSEQTKFPLHYMGMIHYFSYFVREKKVMSLEEAVRKVTSMPATHYRMPKRGYLREGYFADINIFDINNLRENSTLEKPLVYSEGFDYVIVNGVIVLDHDVHTGARPGGNILYRK